MCIFIIIAMLLSGLAAPDPFESDNLDGTRIANWDLSTPENYTLSTTEINGGIATLSKTLNVWSMVNDTDYGTGSPTNLSILADGFIILNTTNDEQLLKNGNFDNPSGGDEADNWNFTSLGTSPTNEKRNQTGGMGDDLYCWRNYYADGSPVAYFDRYVWLNQTINITSIPLSVNTSAFHLFDNNSYIISPGSLAEISITNLNSSESISIASSDWVNETYTDYRPLWSEDSSIFNQTGLYNISLFTLTDSSGDVTHTSPSAAGIENFWDNVSLLFTAYKPEGSYVSDVYDAGGYAMWTNITWEEDRLPSTDISFRVRTGDTSFPTDSVWSDWSAPMTDPTNAAIDRPWSRYIQYMFNISTDITNTTPTVRNVTINYEQFCPSGYIETEDFKPVNITNWGIFSSTDDEMEQTITYYYSTDGGTVWIPVPLDGDLRHVEMNITGSRIRFRAILETDNPMVTPSVSELSIQYVARNPAITLEGVWDKLHVEGGETTRLSVFFNNTAQSISESVWLTIYLDPYLEYISDGADGLSTFDGQEWDNASGIYSYHFTDVAPGANSFWLDAEVATGLDDMTQLSTIVAIEYQDPLDNRVESFLTDISSTIISPLFTITVSSLETGADVGDTIHYRLDVNNTGSGSSPRAWVNGSLDGRLEYLDSIDGSIEDSNISWVLASIPSHSSRSLYLNLSLKDNALQGVGVPASFTVNYTDASGHVRSATSGQHNIIPELTSSFDLEIVSQAMLVHPDESFVITVYFNNSGYGEAPSVRITMTIPEDLILDSSSVAGVENGGDYTWTFTDVAPGTHSFTITFKAADIPGAHSQTNLEASMEVTDPIEGKLDVMDSNNIEIDIERIISIWEKIYWPWSGLLLLVVLSILSYILWVKYKPVPPSIDDAFLIYKDGRLISHQKSARGLRSELDGDIISGMLTAVQQFVNDSLDETGAEKMRKLEFGDRELFMERAENIYIAVIYSGSMNRKLDSQITELARGIEEEFPALAQWNGRMKGLEKVDDYLKDLIEEWQRPDEKNGNGGNGQAGDPAPAEDE